MNLMTKVAATGVALVLGALGYVAADRLDIAPLNATQETTVSVPAPQNLRAYEVGSDYAKVTYGPSVAGPLRITPFPNGRGAKVTWGGSRDDLYPLGITYTFSKNGKALWKDRAQTYANVGFTLTVRSFTTCVVPHSTSGFGPERCVTWSAP